jgi:hypothetical protein
MEVSLTICNRSSSQLFKRSQTVISIFSNGDHTMSVKNQV